MSAAAERDVLVVGGGLAGITAALDLAAAGASVSLVEVRPRLGGGAYSVSRAGLRMDNGQHVFLRCCTAYRALLARLGSERGVRLQERLEIPVLSPGRAPARLRRVRLPAPLQLAPALLSYTHLTLRERVGAARAAAEIGRLWRRGRASDEQTLGEWLAKRGQGERAVAALWDLIALPTLNIPAAEASLAQAAFVFHTGLLASADAGDIGFHEDPLQEVIGTPAARALAAAGVELRLGFRAERLARAGAGFELQGRSEGSEETLAGRAALVALPHERAAGLLEPLLGERASRWRRLGSSPIVNLHVVYDRPVLSERFAAGVGTPVQYLFDRTRAGGAPPGGQYLAVSLSGAAREMRMGLDELRRLYEPALRELLPAARAARIEQFRVTREHAATFRAAPGHARLRAPAQTAVPGLLLAGAWTATGWPATLEGAVLSGHAGARAALAALERDGRCAQGARGMAAAAS